MATVEGKRVKIGDDVGFKSDVEQGATIVNIIGDLLMLEAPDGGFQGEYIKHALTTTVHTSDCWLD